MRNLFTDFKRTSKAYVRSPQKLALIAPSDHARCSPAAAGSRPRYRTCWPASGDTIVTWNDSGWPRDMTAAALVCGSCGTELPPNSKFCNECGAAVAAHDSQPSTSR